MHVKLECTNEIKCLSERAMKREKDMQEFKMWLVSLVILIFY